MQVEQVTITPAMAKRMLEEEEDPNWRTLRPYIVHKYALDMAHKRWRLTGEAIKIDEDGHLVDGQHRLAACVKANAPFETLIARGVPVNAIEAMDTGLKRGLHDFLRHEGYGDPIRVAAAGVLAWRWETGHLLDDVRPGPAEAMAWFSMHPEITVACSRALPYKLVRIVPSAACAFTWRAMQLNEPEEVLFRHWLISGEKMERGHPVLLLRNWLTIGIGRERRNRPDAVTMLAYLIKAWNAQVTGQWPKQLSYKVGEVFPLMVGKAGPV